MQLPEYITVSEVQRVCRELKLRDWTSLDGSEVLPEEASILLSLVNTEGMNINPEDFRNGLQVELEHGRVFSDANVTNNHPVITGKIVLAHMKESLDYYKRLEIAELEGDLFKAAVEGNPEKVRKYMKKLAAAKMVLSQAESEQLSGG